VEPREEERPQKRHLRRPLKNVLARDPRNNPVELVKVPARVQRKDPRKHPRNVLARDPRK
jgi:hypothetical protein